MKPQYLLAITLFFLFSLYSPESPGQILDNSPLTLCNSTSGCLQDPLCTLTDDSFKFDYFGATDLGNGRSALKFRITNYSEQVFRLATFELPGTGGSSLPASKPNSSFRNKYNHSIINPYNDSLIAFEARNAEDYNYGRHEDYYYIVNTADLNAAAGRKTVITARAGRNWKLQRTGSVQFNLNACENTGGRVTLQDFTGITTPEGITLSWKTVTEHQKAHFEIEKSTDGQQFAKIGTVNIATGQTSLQYAFLDKNKTVGATYYRLNQVNPDGTKTYSSSIKIQENLNGADHAGNLEVKLLPNPCFDRNCSIQVLNSNSATPLLLQIHDLTGRTVFSRELPANQNNFELPKIDTGNGVYILTTRNGKAIAHQKVILK